MTDLIRRADVMREMWKHANGKTVLGGQTYQSLTLEVALDAIAALPAVTMGIKPLVWEDFGDWGAKASAYYQANYLIQFWKGREQFEVALSYPGYQTGFDGDRWHPTLDAAKAAAQADYEQRILAAIEPVVAPDLTDPVTVHANMLRGTIAKPTVEQIIHLYGVDALTKALAPVIVREAGIEPVEAPDPAAIREAALREAARLVSARCDAYVAEHGSYDYSTGTTEYPGDGAEWVEEWTDLGNAILALIQKGAADDRA